MPRSSLRQGIAGGVAVLTARAIGLAVDAVATKVATETQMTSFDRALARREVERAERIDAGKAASSEGSIDRAASETQ